MKRINWALVIIVLLGFFLRTWRLGWNPPGLYWDEVSLGWNAYSILTTGMDEHGRFLPIDTFFAFGDYKPPLYIYAAVPSIWLFGLNEFAVRVPSAVAGTLLIVVTYFLAKELVGNKQQATSNKKNQFMPLLSAFLVAVSPWSVTLSRVAFESNLAVLLNALGVLFFVYAVYRSARWLPVSVLSFVLAAYTFNANRLLSPIFLIVLTLIYYKTVLGRWRWWLGSAILGAVLVLPMVGHLSSPAGKLRWREVNIFSNLSVIEESNRRREIDGNSLISRGLHHRYLGFTRSFLSHYLDGFDLKYLFVSGDPNPRISVPDMGEMYLVELPFFIIGLISLISPIWQIRRIATREKSVLFLWLLMAAIPAGLARETPHALRSASTLPVPQIIISMGVISLISQIRRIRRILLFAFCFLLFVSVGYFQLIYWRYYPKEWAGEWLTAYKPLVQYLKETGSDYKTIYVTPDLGRPYIYFLFYGGYEPNKYIEDAAAGGRVGDAFGFFNVNSFGKYRFYIPDLDTVAADDLVVTRADSPPPGFSLVKTIVDVNGHPEFNVIRKQ